MITIKINKERCAGHARCAAVAPEVYELDETGYIAFEGRVVGEDLRARATRGARACPERVITVLDETSGEGQT
ncbi:MAG: ferredoxin [Caulobacter sp.]